LASGGEKERLIEKEEREIVERRENKKDEAKVFFEKKTDIYDHLYLILHIILSYFHLISSHLFTGEMGWETRIFQK